MGSPLKTLGSVSRLETLPISIGGLPGRSAAWLQLQPRQSR
jgi:hypothetical protein